MKAGILENTGHLLVREVPTPELQEGSVLIRVKACAICTTDLRTYRNGSPRIAMPHILGHEISGQIEAVSSEVSGYRVGSRVVINPKIPCGKCYYCVNNLNIYCLNSMTFGYELPGGYADYVLVPKNGVEYGVIKQIDDSIRFEEAALAEPLSCCFRAQKLSRIDHSDTIIVIGGGPVGIMHCRLARVNGAGRIILIEKNTRRLQYVDISGIDLIIDPSKSNPEAELRAITTGRGADVAIIACSSKEAQEQAISLAGDGGRVIFFSGLLPDQSTICIDSNLIHYREISVQGSHGSTPDDTREVLDLLVWKELYIRDIVTQTFPLDAIETAFHLAEKREGMRVVVCP